MTLTKEVKIPRMLPLKHILVSLTQQFQSMWILWKVNDSQQKPVEWLDHKERVSCGSCTLQYEDTSYNCSAIWLAQWVKHQTAELLVACTAGTGLFIRQNFKDTQKGNAYILLILPNKSTGIHYAGYCKQLVASLNPRVPGCLALLNILSKFRWSFYWIMILTHLARLLQLYWIYC